MNLLLIIAALSLIILCFNNKSNFNEVLLNVYNNTNDPKSCDFEKEYRPYPSGHVTGSYLGLSRQEQHTLLINFVYDHPDYI